MSWHYACVKKEAEFDEGYEYHLVEVFPMLAKFTVDTDEPPYAENVTFVAGSTSELAKWLRIAADDIEKHGVINE